MIESTDTVHDAMDRAIERKYDSELKPFTFKAPEGDLAQAKAICDRHGVTFGSWLRECVSVLVDQYCPPKDQ